MKQLTNYITEKFKINSKTTKQHYSCQPKDKEELISILADRLSKRNTNLNDIDVSEITNMSSLFFNLDPDNIDISEWDVSNVTNMESMFFRCNHLECDLSKWDVSKVINMSHMFWGCSKFNSDLNKWNVSKVKDMKDMFDSSPLEKNPPKWFKKK